MPTASLQVKVARQQIVDECVMEQVTPGVRHRDLQKKLLRKNSTFTLDQALDLGRIFEASRRHMEELDKIQANQKIELDVIRRPNIHTPGRCLWCGRQHSREPEACPAHGTICDECGKPNHWG